MNLNCSYQSWSKPLIRSCKRTRLEYKGPKVDRKAMCDVSYRNLKFKVSKKVFLNVVPIKGVLRFRLKGVLRFRQKGKLSPCFIKPFEILN